MRRTEMIELITKQAKEKKVTIIKEGKDFLVIDTKIEEKDFDFPQFGEEIKFDFLPVDFEFGKCDGKTATFGFTSKWLGFEPYYFHDESIPLKGNTTNKCFLMISIPDLSMPWNPSMMK
jgi:hypothetical protein